MQIGDVIRNHRKQLNMTQEEMANRLGVTAPAVNKWEKGNAYPDIMMLAPIARLLNITLDELLSFQERVSEEEIKNYVQEIDKRLKSEPYENVFQWTKDIMERYPNCKSLIWQMTVILDAQRMFRDVADAEQYDMYILRCYERVLESEEETLRNCAADSLFGYYIRKEDYETAERYLTYFSEQNPERKRKQALIYSKTNRTDEAYKVYEELLFANYQMTSMVLNSICALAMEGGNLDKAHTFVTKQQELAKLFEMGKYYEASCGLELAVLEKDVEATIEIVKTMLASVDNIGDFGASKLYEHMTFKKMQPEVVKEMEKDLLRTFQDEEAFGFLKEDERWREMIQIKRD